MTDPHENAQPHSTAPDTRARAHGPAPRLLRRVRFPGGADLYDVALGRGRVAGVRPHDPGAVPTSGEEHAPDLDGRVLIPGLWDAHVHLGQWAAARRRLDVSGTASAQETVRAVREGAAALPPGELVTGYGFRDGLWPDAPHKRLLDALPEARPALLISADLHTAWLNSAGLALLGQGGHPTGVLREGAAMRAVAQLSSVPAETLDGWVADACAAAARRGVTGVVDFEVADNVTDWERRAAGAPPLLRVAAAVYPEYLEAAVARGLRTGSPLAPLVETGPLKLFTDGSLNTRTALCHAPYPGLDPAAPEAYGLARTVGDDLVTALRTASGHGLEPAVHAIGDRANQLALDAFAAVGCRGRIEHGQLVRTEDFGRFAELGVTVGVQPSHAVDDRDVADQHWAGHTARAFAYAALLAAGARLELGSDAPVAPLDPWLSIANAVARTDDRRPPWHPEQRLTPAQALAASTGAQSGISAGAPADLAVLDADPLTADDATLRRLPVHATLLAGAWTHREG
ncbi:amidohydrolase [Streptomyces reniochalinae]|uniref:Amidohydrolase n=1 Tax=Streptomyces reniochalinae TaxID=2250578 RepID=A0A367EVM5_9ACTN|nr:amidohydrolase family protein [Streptomyces reniochalinae]RCG22188.1 amidohydrolase [Streptomyces reniochalinae]